MLEFIINLILSFFRKTTPPVQAAEPTPMPEEKQPEVIVPEEVVVPKYLWDTPANARHSVRVICDEEGLTVAQKNELCATVQCESGFNIHTVHPNIGKDGKVHSTDYGICQWNDYYHGKEISPDEALHNPEKAVRLMCAYWKRGQGRLWVCYSKELYKKYL